MIDGLSDHCFLYGSAFTQKIGLARKRLIENESWRIRSYTVKEDHLEDKTNELELCWFQAIKKGPYFLKSTVVISRSVTPEGK
jgi:hypothetical protein